MMVRIKDTFASCHGRHSPPSTTSVLWSDLARPLWLGF